ncbi:MAG: PAS domain S-box protein [Bacteroidales bacterium]|nr:PAS domain S-box protein [Bacteroidales bacterium]
MKFLSFKEATNQATFFSIILTICLLTIGILLTFMADITSAITFTSIGYAIISRPALWVLILLVFLIPLITYLIYNNFAKKLSEMQESLENESSKSYKINSFVSELIQENFETEYSLEGEDDKLGKSLLELRNTLKSNREIREKRRKEDEIRNWTAEGLANFGEILRRDNDNLNNFSFNVIKNLTNYINAIQGGFYLLQNEDDKKNRFFNLISFYAYGRKKFADNRIPWGKGIIGTSGLENKTIYITDLPDTYVTVTSGLGKANPRNLIVAPLIANEELFGVFEIASLNKLDKHQISFVEKVAESTASILSSVKMNMQTARLLEESKSQAQALSSQEEEMRQNMEELQATQEEAARQAQRFLKLETTVNHTMLRAEYHLNGILLYANTKFLNKLEYEANADVEGKHISMFISKKDEEWFQRIWNNLVKGGRHFEGYMKHVTKTGKDLWTMATYTCIRDEDGEVEQILFLGLDTTEHKKLSLNLEGIVDAVNRSSISIEFDINGNIKEYNESFLYLFKYSEKEISGLAIFDLIDTLELELFNKKWENVVRGMNFQGAFKVKTKSGEERWIRGAFSAVYNMYSEVEKVIYIGNDITREKLMEIESKKQNEIFKIQEKQLRETEKELSKKLKESRLEMKEQFKEIERIKIRNERTLEGALDAIITTSNDNKIIFFNEAAVILFGYNKDEVIGKDVGILFSNKTIAENEFVNKYTGPGDKKIVGQRKEVKIKTKKGDEIPVLILLSNAQVEKENTYTAFIQTIEVELF